MMTDGKIVVSQMVEDVVLTKAFLIKGKVEGKFHRLSKLLNTYGRNFLVLSGATMIDLVRGETIRTPKVHVNLNEIVLAHELVETSGDFYQKNLASEGGKDKSVRIRAFHHGAANLEFTGLIRPGAYEAQALESRFFVMEDCSIRGFDPEMGRDFQKLEKLPYAILRKEAISYIYDFSQGT